MTGLDHVLCASQASTAICSSMESIETSSSSAAQLGGKAIDRHNPIITDGRRSFSRSCSSFQTINSKPAYHQLQKTKLPPADDVHSTKSKKEQKKSKKKGEQQRKSSATSSLFKLLSDDISFARKSISCARPVGDFIRTPPGSSRYLLGEPGFLDERSDHDPVDDLVNPSDPKKAAPQAPLRCKEDKSLVASKPKSPSFSEKKPPSDKVVVLRVSLHCKGCEGKVRKHLSRMQGVASFNIDFAAKKVTVTGDVTPLEVLASISKVKSAQLWTNPPSSAPSLRAIPEIGN